MRRGGFLRRESAVVWVLGIGKAEGNGVRRHGAIECMNTDVLFFPPLFALEMVEWGMGLFLFSFLFFFILVIHIIGAVGVLRKRGFFSGVSTLVWARASLALLNSTLLRLFTGTVGRVG